MGRRKISSSDNVAKFKAWGIKRKKCLGYVIEPLTGVGYWEHADSSVLDGSQNTRDIVLLRCMGVDEDDN